jgi:hypothetical protein
MLSQRVARVNNLRLSGWHIEDGNVRNAAAEKFAEFSLRELRAASVMIERSAWKLVRRSLSSQTRSQEVDATKNVDRQNRFDTDKTVAVNYAKRFVEIT